MIGKSGKDITRDKALSHVSGYLVTNDLSSRAWQSDPRKAGGVPHWCFSKGFDKFAPLSPVQASQLVIGNGEERQNSSTNDLLFGIEDILTFLSQGTTPEVGTVILTGTPSGVAIGVKGPKYMDDGDVVDVSITGLGHIRNKIVFDKEEVGFVKNKI